jgi:hypothetical protein
MLEPERGMKQGWSSQTVYRLISTTLHISLILLERSNQYHLVTFTMVRLWLQSFSDFSGQVATYCMRDLAARAPYSLGFMSNCEMDSDVYQADSRSDFLRPSDSLT